MRAADPSDLAAGISIRKLGLDIRKLQALRRQAIDPFLEPGLSEADVSQFAAGYLRKDAEGRFGEFWTTIHYLFGASVTQ